MVGATAWDLHADETASAVRGAMPRLPALDGLRGLAVAGVLAFHTGAGWATGGFLGVSTFFTLSGFLITNLLVREWDRNGDVDARRFWSRRFRRLLPAALVTLAGTAVATWLLGTPEQIADLRGDVLASLGYVANWRFVLAGSDYATLAGDPSPLQHFWSLAIEEQFYLLFPLVAIVALRHGGRRSMAAACTVGAAASLAAGLVLAGDPERVYLGTDARAFELLAGALLALWWSARPDADEPDRPAWHGAGKLADLAGVAVGLVALGAWAVVGEESPWLGRGGFAVHAALTCVVIHAATRRGVVCTVLSVAPLRWLGRISYGVYLYHWPVFLFLDEERTGLDGVALLVARLGITLVIAIVSYRWLEQPVLSGRLLREPRRAALAAVAGFACVASLAVLTTLDPPPSTIPFAGSSMDDFGPRVVERDDSDFPAVGVQGPSTVPDGSTEAEPGVDPRATVPTFPLVPAPEVVLVVGDSGTVDAAPAISAAFTAAGTRRVVSVAAPGFGLTVRGADVERRWGEPVRREDPDLVVVMFGGWDTPFVRDSGDEAYAALVDESVQVLTSRGARVLWLAMLPGGETPERLPDRVHSKLPERFPGVVHHWDIAAALADVGGGFPREIDDGGRRLLLRKPDGWHLCPDGAERVASSTLAGAVVAGLAPPAPPGWEQGSWRSDPVYDDPPGGCVR